MIYPADRTPDEPPAEGDEALLAEFLDEALVRLNRGEAVSAQQLLGASPHLVGRGRRLLEQLEVLVGMAAGMRRQESLLQSELLALSSEGDPSAAGGETPPDPFPGEFRIVRRLGEGAFGTVWLAEDVHLGRRVALKTIVAAGPSRPAEHTLARLREEARLLAAVRHRNVVQVHAWRETAPSPRGAAAHYLVLQYVPGGSLAGRVREEGPLPWQLAGRYIADVAEGLLEVHARGIVHRDVKPANILWDPEADEALLTDFGIAVRLAEAGAAAGTPLYMAPEALAGQGGSAQDVYALAASLFWLVTGSAPFPGLTRAQIADQARLGLPDPDPRCTELPRPLEQLIRAGLTADPERRPDLSAFVTGLRGALNQLLADSLPAAPGVPPGLRLTVSRQVDHHTFVPVATTQPQPERFLRDLRRVPPEPNQVDVRTGDRVRIEVETDRPGHVTVFNVGPTGNLNLLYPAAWPVEGPPAVTGGQPLRLLDIELTPPAGQERLFALWTREPLPLRPDEMLSLAGTGRLPVSGPYRATRDMTRVRESVRQLRPEDWSVAVLNLCHLAAQEAGGTAGGPPRGGPGTGSSVARDPGHE
jgi:serine/threonine protein kinase